MSMQPLRVCGYRLGDPRIIAKRLGIVPKPTFPALNEAAERSYAAEAVKFELQHQTRLHLALHNCVRVYRGKPTSSFSLVVSVRTSHDGKDYKQPEDRVRLLAKLMGREGKQPAWWIDMSSIG
ncbi:hypothetical protein BD410DRAFT_793105 [Rickenella mellea]|uniref:Uncharacterized protein n=1 Tax=Rickenella mellea TaxID=50990 RepID=A0A4Y7PTR9_9AGAM|nr:hypothetical protein BD410DRAFT_793105 [Rickenella mellea]